MTTECNLFIWQISLTVLISILRLNSRTPKSVISTRVINENSLHRVETYGLALPVQVNEIIGSSSGCKSSQESSWLDTSFWLVFLCPSSSISNNCVHRPCRLGMVSAWKTTACLALPFHRKIKGLFDKIMFIFLKL